MIINENGWGNQQKAPEAKESVKAKKIKQLNEGAELPKEDEQDGDQE